MNIHPWSARMAPVAAIVALLAGCATAYEPDSFSGGFSEIQINPDTWSVRFGGNGYTTAETVQTYWLYHCAEFTLAHGYQGFRILTPMNLAAIDPGRGPSGAELIKVRGGHGGGRVVTYSYGYATSMAPKPTLMGAIKLLHAPIRGRPEDQVFDAAAIKASLDRYVKGEKCGGNVCPHLHSYLYSQTP
jgi:hypothetical protein